MVSQEPHFELRLASSPEDIRAAQRLRYEVFVAELGADGALVDHEARLEADRFDPFFDHLILLDHRRSVGDQIVGVYRVMQAQGAKAAGQFYSEDEYDLAPLKSSGRRLLELGRSCVHTDYRGGTALMHLWNGLADYIVTHEIEILFGVASLHGTDVANLAAPLSLLHHRHLAPEELRPTAWAAGYQDMNLIAEDALDRTAATRALPALIKAYLRLGGAVGKGAFVDHAFNCTDICLILDTALMPEKHRALYARGRGV